MEDLLALKLKVFWKRGIAFAEILASAPRIRALRDALVGMRGEEAHLLRLRLAQLLEKAMERKRDRESASLMDELRPLAVECRVNEPKADNTVLNAEFIVEKKRKAEFDAKVRELKAANAGRLTVAYKDPTLPSRPN